MELAGTYEHNEVRQGQVRSVNRLGEELFESSSAEKAL